MSKDENRKKQYEQKITHWQPIEAFVPWIEHVICIKITLNAQKTNKQQTVRENKNNTETFAKTNNPQTHTNTNTHSLTHTGASTNRPPWSPISYAQRCSRTALRQGFWWVYFDTCRNNKEYESCILICEPCSQETPPSFEKYVFTSPVRLSTLPVLPEKKTILYLLNFIATKVVSNFKETNTEIGFHQ